MVNENLVLTEYEFNEFKGFCCRCGFELCYYGTEISGSKEVIERHQFDSPKIIKLKERQFNFVGIPYDVAEYEQKDWNAVLPQLKAEFLDYIELVKVADEKPDRRKNWNESWAFPRLAATALSAGLLLALVPVDDVVIPWISLGLFLASMLFLLAEWSRFFKAKWFEKRDWVLRVGELMTPIFVVISVASIIFNWSKIMSLLYGGDSPQPEPTWVQPFYAQASTGWLIFFVITLGAPIIWKEKSVFGRHDRRQKLKRACRLALAAGVVIVVFWVSLTNIIEARFRGLFVLGLTFLVLFIVFYFLREKDSTEKEFIDNTS